MKRIKKRLKNRIGEKKVAVIKKILNVVRIIKNIICWLLLAVIAVSVITFVVIKASGGTPSVFGYSIHRVMSGSMMPELEVGDVIVNKDVKNPSEIRIGEIITFDGGSAFNNEKITHRVLVAPYDDKKGNIVLVTKGDANVDDDGEINFNSVESKYVTKLGFLKNIYDFFFSKWGLLLLIFLLILIFFDEILNLAKLTVARFEESEGDKSNDSGDSEKSLEKPSNKQKRISLKKMHRKKKKNSNDYKPISFNKRPVKKKSKKKVRRKISKKSKRKNKRR